MNQGQQQQAQNVTNLLQQLYHPTDQQLKAATSLAKKITVSAGAGTGKTFTLALRYLFCCGMGFQPRRILTLTFTEKAATEMKDRIRCFLDQTLTYLQNQPSPNQDLLRNFQQAKQQFSQSKISTIHGFSLNLIAEQGLMYNLPTNATLITEAANIEFNERMINAFEHLTLEGLGLDANNRQTFEALLNDPFTQKLLQVYKPTTCVNLFRQILDEQTAQGVALDEPRITALKNQLETDLQGLGDQVTDEQIDRSLKFFEQVLNLARLYLSARHKFYSEFNYLSYSDMIAQSCQLAQQIEESLFDQILADEYQDTDPLQDKLIMALVKKETRCFMVGDIKQSIYSFRHAKPQLFANHCNNSDEHVDLTQNYRSNQAVLQWVNQTFAPLFAQTPPISYSPLETPSQHQTALPVGEILEYEKDESLDRLLDRLQELITNQTPIQLKNGATRPLQWGDCAILMPTQSDFQRFRQKCRQRHIPCVLHGEKRYFSLDEIKDTIALLRALSNKDLLSLAHWLCSPFSSLSLEDAYKWLQSVVVTQPVVNQLPEAQQAQFEQLELEGRLNGAGSVISKLLSHRSFWKSIPKAKRKFTLWNLRHLLELLETHQQTSLPSLLNQADYLSQSDQINSDHQLPQAHSDSALTLMTVHSSKGLEFPLVAVYNVDRDWSKSSGGLGEKLIFSPYTQFYSSKFDDDVTDNPIKTLHNNQEGAVAREEQLRLFYVAATRAREGLILATKDAKPDKPDKPSKKKNNDLSSAQPSFTDAKSWKDFLALVSPSQPNPALTQHQHQPSTPHPQTTSPQNDGQQEQPQLIPATMVDLDFDQLSQPRQTRLISLEATSYALGQFCPYAWRMCYRQGYLPQWNNGQTVAKKPQSIGGTVQGTLLHHYLSKIDLFNPPSSVKNFVEQTPPPFEMRHLMADPSVVDDLVQKICHLLDDPQFQGLLKIKGGQIYKEWPLSAKATSAQRSDPQTTGYTSSLVGIIDLALRYPTDQGEKWVLLDYKNNASNSQATHFLAQVQLSFYNQLLKITGGTNQDADLYFYDLTQSRLKQLPPIPLDLSPESVRQICTNLATGPWNGKANHCPICPFNQNCPQSSKRAGKASKPRPQGQRTRTKASVQPDLPF